MGIYNWGGSEYIVGVNTLSSKSRSLDDGAADDDDDDDDDDVVVNG